MKRFYKLVTRAPCPGGFEIHLDGRPVKTPEGRILTVPVESIADGILKEWAAQGAQIRQEDLPLTQILVTVQERIPAHRAALEKEVMAYLDTDLLCYRAGNPAAMGARQAAAWDPWLGWFEKRFGVALLTTEGLTAVRQPPAAHEAVKKLMAGLDDMRFCILQIATALGGSLVLALAFLEGAISPVQLLEAIHAEELFKRELFNEDVHGAAPHEEKKRELLLKDLNAAQFFLSAL